MLWQTSRTQTADDGGKGRVLISPAANLIISVSINLSVVEIERNATQDVNLAGRGRKVGSN